ncbi:MAG: nucleoside monophosphate kinase [bacterium]|nr:nucleoside monophosphate kinase [bacterium]
MIQKHAVMIFGTPGSGKGTQANLLMWIKGYYHFDSGKYLRSVLYDPANQDKKIIQKERKLNEAGILNTPSWVLGLFKKETTKVAKAGMSIVYSGSPRTMYEAFGDEKTPGLVAIMEKLYGKENVNAFSLTMSPGAGAKRNAKRRTCSVCSTGVLADSTDTVCPICGGQFKVRIDDNPEVAQTRIAEYETRTKPILAELQKRGVPVHELSGEQPPHVVHAEILKILE